MKNQPVLTQKDKDDFVSDRLLLSDVQTKTIPKKPDSYRIFLINDDYTPMNFVVYVLQHFFHKDHATAVKIMMRVHIHGKGECGVYSREVAETKRIGVMDLARRLEYPLQCVMECK